ncbi:LysM peptidoglycan-binding domain-containing protein [Metabacillus idriensis]|uniref:LysM peptidoglycan-binding domain-containing protein n=1 Tax=Metabacillus idriensis TaxID=324768 RepID=UPI00203F6F3E|nr:LysM peptidoglycan-binding domain-containing protein [Metabacillus idriensis]MCM3598718.1 LysM peptidoglycan-binding domain-containing protein [Metabacillus idriensis]
MAKLGHITVFVEKESGFHGVETTRYAVEKGEPFIDHVKKRPSEWTLSGYILKDNWKMQLESLKKIMNAGQVVKYVGKTMATDVIIREISDDYSSNIENGFALSITLQKVRITKTAWIKVSPKQKPAQKPTTNSGKKKPVQKKPRTSAAVYHKVKKGETYWLMNKKYGTSIAQLRTWNKYPDRKIPIGVKLRVK